MKDHHLLFVCFFGNASGQMIVRFREKRTRFRAAVEGVVVDDVVDAILLCSDVVSRLVQVDGGDVVKF
jgi:hypothetical protein